jgi:hypothetical protein
MKKLSLVLLILLSGCSSLIEAYLMKYDTNEYFLINDVRTAAQLGQLHCDDAVESKANAESLATKTLTLMNFAQYQPHNKPVQNSSIELNKIAQGLNDQYHSGNSVSTTFCRIKFKIVEDAATTIQQSEGNKPK